MPVSGSGIDASSGRFSVRSWESESPGLLAAVAVAADFERDDVPKKSTSGSDSAAFGPRREPAGVRLVDPPPLWLEALLVRRERARRKRPKRLVVDFADAEVSNSSAGAWAAALPPPSMTRATVVAGLLGRTASFPNRKTEAFDRGNGPWRKGLRSFLPVSSDGKSGSTNFLGRESLVLPCPFALPRLSTPLPHSSLARAENRAPPPLSLSLAGGRAMRRGAPVLLLCCFCASVLLLLLDPASVSARQLSSAASTPSSSSPSSEETAAAAAPPLLEAEEEPPLPLLLAPADAQPPLESPSGEEEGDLRGEEEEDEEEGFIISLDGDGSFDREAPPTPPATAPVSSSSSSPAARPFAVDLVHVSSNSSLLEPLYGGQGGEEESGGKGERSKLPAVAQQALAAAAALAAGVGVGALLALLATRLLDLWRYRRAGGRIIMHPSMGWARWVRGRVRVRRTTL